MKVIILNIRDAEQVFCMEHDGLFYQYVDDFLKNGERLLPEGAGIDFPALPDVGDVIPLHFQCSGRETKPHHYYVLGRVFQTPVFRPEYQPTRFVPEITLFVHSDDDATNTNWDSE